jgi:hypothetical protein
MRPILQALLLMAFVRTAVAQEQSWHIDDHPFPTSIGALPLGDQRTILATISASIDRYAKQEDLEPNEVATVRKNLRVQRVKTRSSSLLLLQAYGPELCGAVGNCAVWVLDEHNRLLLDGAGGSKVTVTQNEHYGQPDIRFAIHDSASETALERWQFDGLQYRNVSCATLDYGSIQRYKHPVVSRVSCATWK